MRCEADLPFATISSNRDTEGGQESYLCWTDPKTQIRKPVFQHLSVVLLFENLVEVQAARTMSITVSGEFKRQVDANAASLVESYRLLLKKTQVGSSLEVSGMLRMLCVRCVLSVCHMCYTNSVCPMPRVPCPMYSVPTSSAVPSPSPSPAAAGRAAAGRGRRQNRVPRTRLPGPNQRDTHAPAAQCQRRGGGRGAGCGVRGGGAAQTCGRENAIFVYLLCCLE